MIFSNIWPRVQGRFERTVNQMIFTRPLVMHNTVPYISFTFDDFPRSALHEGGKILIKHGINATYFASLGLMGTEAPTGTIFISDDLKELFADGHELGCHTYGHCHSWKTNRREFENSIVTNKQALNDLVPGVSFKSFSYPISGPRPFTKRLVGKYFDSCRGGGQTFNAGVADLNLLKAYFLEKSIDNIDFVKETIDKNCKAVGWLILATHDISETPSPYGCTPTFFEDIVKFSLASGARILPVTEALDEIRNIA